MATSSTVTSTARLHTASSSESFSLANANIGSLNIGDADFTLAIWVNATTLSGVDPYIGMWGGGSLGYYLIYCNGTTFSFSVQNSSGTNTTVSKTSNSTSTWYLLVGTHNATTNEIEFFVNNTSAGTASHSNGIRTSAVPFFIGSDSLNRYADFKWQSAGFWTRVLSGSELTELYNSGVAERFDALSDNLNDAYVYYDGVETSGIAYNATATATKNLTDNNTVTSAAGIITYNAEKAAQFTSANSEYLSITNASQSGLSPGDVDFSGYAWAYLDSTGVFRTIFGKYNSTGNLREYSLSISNASKAVFQVSSSGTSGTETVLAHSQTLVASTWYFISFYHDATNNLLGIAVNNGTFETTAHTTGVYQGTASFLFGARNEGAANLMNGRVGVSGFISGIPTSAEWTSIYERGFGANNTAKPALSSASYVSVWNLNEESGTRYDSVGSNDLTDNNTVTQADGVVLYTAPVVGGSTKGGLCLLGVGL